MNIMLLTSPVTTTSAENPKRIGMSTEGFPSKLFLLADGGLLEARGGSPGVDEESSVVGAKVSIGFKAGASVAAQLLRHRKDNRIAQFRSLNFSNLPLHLNKKKKVDPDESSCFVKVALLCTVLDVCADRIGAHWRIIRPIFLPRELS